MPNISTMSIYHSFTHVQPIIKIWSFLTHMPMYLSNPYFHKNDLFFIKMTYFHQKCHILLIFIKNINHKYPCIYILWSYFHHFSSKMSIFMKSHNSWNSWILHVQNMWFFMFIIFINFMKNVIFFIKIIKFS